MQRYVAVWFGTILIAVVATYAVGQQQPNERSTCGNFAVSPAGNSSVLVDTRTGQTWLLHHSANSAQSSTWLPVAKIDRFDEASNWKAAEREQAKQNAVNREDASNSEISRLGEQIKEIEAKIRSNR
jgi:hypothetical protein